MIQDRWTVYAHFGLDRDEISWHKSPEVAQNVAREYTNQHDRPTSVDLNIPAIWYSFCPIYHHIMLSLMSSYS